MSGKQERLRLMDEYRSEGLVPAEKVREVVADLMADYAAHPRKHEPGSRDDVLQAFTFAGRIRGHHHGCEHAARLAEGLARHSEGTAQDAVLAFELLMDSYAWRHVSQAFDAGLAEGKSLLAALDAIKDAADAPGGCACCGKPIAPDNTAGYAHLRRLGLIPLAAGENLHTLAEFAGLIAAGGVDFPEPDLTTCGGVTPFMKIAHLCEAHGLPVTSHGAHDVHVHLLAAAPNAAYLEVHGFGLEKFMAHSVEIADGMATAPDRPGHGIEFDWPALAAHRAR